jgi:hypothetical protein
MHSLGFKYIGNTALNLVEQGYDVLFGYEEAIGFMFSSDLPDKDGVAATVSLVTAPILSNLKWNLQVLFAELAVSLYQDGKTVWSHLKDLYKRLLRSSQLIFGTVFNFLSDMATSKYILLPFVCHLMLDLLQDKQWILPLRRPFRHEENLYKTPQFSWNGQ